MSANGEMWCSSSREGKNCKKLEGNGMKGLLEVGCKEKRGGRALKCCGGCAARI
jgi:hypothetical protein